MTITDSVFRSNESVEDGGAIVSLGTLDVAGTEISGNTAGGAAGGLATNGTTRITNATVSGNVADGMGGGIFASGGATTLANVTVVRNRAGAGKGAAS